MNLSSDLLPTESIHSMYFIFVSFFSVAWVSIFLNVYGNLVDNYHLSVLGWSCTKKTVKPGKDV